MTHTPLKVADYSTLTAQIATLEFQIARLVKLINATSFKTGSLMLAGRSSLSKDFHELITWRDGTPLPRLLLRNFLQHYCNHLIYQKNLCALYLQGDHSSFQDQTRVCHCGDCTHDTLQLNYFIITGSAGAIIPAPAGTWICSQCETIIKEVSHE